MTIRLELGEEFVKEHHLASVHDEAAEQLVQRLIPGLCAIEEVRVVPGLMRLWLMDETYEAFFSSIATFIKLTCWVPPLLSTAKF